MEWNKILLIYIVSVNILSLIIFGWDKAQAVRGGGRIAEKTLFILVLLGGGGGALAGMKIWRHKTRKWYFRYGIPAIILIQAGIVIYLMGRMSRG